MASRQAGRHNNIINMMKRNKEENEGRIKE